jgi:hypothetical protein
VRRLARDAERDTESPPADAGAKQRLNELLLTLVEFAALKSDSSERLEQLFDVGPRGCGVLRCRGDDRPVMPGRLGTVARRHRPVQPDR